MLKFFTSDLRRNLTKILCLTVGLAVGLLLIAKVYFEQSYDTFLKDSDRLYKITENFTQNGEYQEYNQIAGAVAPGLKRYVPQIEAATRVTMLTGDGVVEFKGEETSFSIDGMMMADSCFFDVIERDILAGDPHDALTAEFSCMIPRSMAEKIGGDVVGKMFKMNYWSDDLYLTVGGVYEDFQENSVFNNIPYVSLSTIAKVSYDGRENWIDNDRYIGYLRLAEGVNPDDLKPTISKMLEDNVDKETLDQSHYGIFMKPLVGVYSSQDSVKMMSWIMTLLAVIILLTSGTNYLLIVISQFTKRSKEMAVRKCYGTGNYTLFMRVLSESLIYLVISGLLGILLLFCLKDVCVDLLGQTPAILFSNGAVWGVEGIVILVLLIITGIIPAWIYCVTPVTHAFRKNIKSKKGWKVALLGVEFIASGFLLCLLIVVVHQYRMLSDIDMGFDYENIGIIPCGILSDTEAKTIKAELKKLGEVEGAAFSYQGFSEHASGNNVWIDGMEENNVNVADLYNVDPEIFEVMGIKFLDGSNFHEVSDSTVQQVIVEEKFIDIFRDAFNDKDQSIVGKTFRISDHNGGLFTICGVVENMRRGGFSMESADKRAAVMFPSPYAQYNMFVRFNKISPEALTKAQDVINRVVPEKEVYITPYKDSIEALTVDVKKFGTSVLIVGIAILLIALLGLSGYTADEVQRRSKEIAIRKVVGTSEKKILKLFSIDMLKIALPSLVIGAVLAYIVGRNWLSQFTEQVSTSPIVFILAVLLLIILILFVMILCSISVARSNPVNYLRNE